MELEEISTSVVGLKFSIEFRPQVAHRDKSQSPNFMVGIDGDLNRSTQHLLILLDKEVADGDVTDIVHGEAEG